MTVQQGTEDMDIDGASCRIFRDAPAWDGEKTAAIGQFRCVDPTAGRRLLQHATARLKTEMFTRILGPMDGDTWHSYRVVIESDSSKPFFMEPVSGPHDREVFEQSGFLPVSTYVSTRTSLTEAIGKGEPIRLEDIIVTPWDGNDAEGLVGQLFDMSTARFSKNKFFKPIVRTEFAKLYAPIIPAIDPRLVLFAHDRSKKLCGFLLGLSNRNEGEASRSVILKTYASGRRGVGHLLADTFHRTAQQLGYSDVIHALMHTENVSLTRSTLHTGRIFRKYALMGRRLVRRHESS
jgi:hypothetical protein